MKKVNENYISAFGHLINTKDIPLFDSTDYPEYEDYVQWCEDNERKPQGPNSNDYFDYCGWNRESDLENFWWEAEHGKLSREKYIVTGSAGLWWGRPTIVPEVFDNFKDAMCKIVGRDIQDIRLTLMADGSIQVQALHHDGTNVYYIHKLSKKGLQGVEAAEARWEDPEPKEWWYRRIYIDEIEF